MGRGIADDRGASSVEYGLIVFAVAALIATSVAGFGGVINVTYSNSCDVIAAKVTSETSC